MGVVDDIKNKLDIVDYISQSVPTLKKAGRTYKGLCPFHSEKTPSFVVYPDSQNWHCFGACGVGGDIFNFVMRQEGLDFGEALRFLAPKAGVLLEERSPEAIEADKTRQKLLEMMAVAARFYHQYLIQEPQGEFARTYVAQRGLSEQTINQFQLGYAPNQWEILKTHLLQRGYSQADLVAGGLIVTRDDGSPGYDRFRERFMVPIRDLQGRVIGFGARALQENQVPKYLNSPQGMLFDKSSVIFGLDMAKNAIRDQGQAVIVEGYMDVLQAHERGYNNVVAQMGTALTEGQLQVLKRYADQFVFALDADTAGSAATLRGINVARAALAEESLPVPTAQGLLRYESKLKADIRIATLPPGKDPDDILKAGPTEWPELIKQARPVVDYYIQTVIADLDLNTAKGKSTAVQTILPFLQEIENSVEQAHYLQQLATLVRIDERTLRAELQTTAQQNKQIVKPSAFVAPPKIADTNKPFGVESEELCLAMIFGHPLLLEQVNRKLVDNGVELLTVQDFSKTENKTLFLALKNWAITENRSIDALLGAVDKYLEGHLASIIDLWHRQPASAPEQVERQLPKLILNMRRRRLERQNQELLLLQRDAQDASDRKAATEYTKLVNETALQLQKLHKAHDALSIMGRRRIEEKYH